MLLQTKTNKTVIRKSSGFFVSFFCHKFQENGETLTAAWLTFFAADSLIFKY